MHELLRRFYPAEYYTLCLDTRYTAIYIFSKVFPCLEPELTLTLTSEGWATEHHSGEWSLCPCFWSFLSLEMELERLKGIGPACFNNLI